MPELPEVETVRTQLEKHTVGKTVSAIESFHERSLTGNPVKVTGRKITDIKRYGKMLILELGKEWVIGIHLKMSGQLIYQKPGAGRLKQDKHTRVIIKFNSGDYLIFNDQRIFGWVKIMKSEELRTMNYIKNLGPEPWDISDEEFFNKIRTRNRPIKLVILDQEIISGVGNIYANDALWEAGIKPSRKARSMKKTEAVNLKKSLIKVLREGIRYGGSTGQDGKYIDLMGEQGEYQKHFRTYDRTGKKCLRGDGGIIQKISLGGRGTYFCPVCQK